MTCCEYENRLSAFLDGELPRWTRWKVQNHLRGCRQCQMSLQELTAINGSLLAMCEADPAPEYLTGAIMHRLPAMPPARPRRHGVMPWAAGLAVAGMQALALFGAYWWGFMRGTTNPVPSFGSATVVSPGGLGRTTGASPAGESASGSPLEPVNHRGPIWSTTGRYGPMDTTRLQELESNGQRHTPGMPANAPRMNVVVPAPAR